MVPYSTPSATGGDTAVRSRRSAALGHLHPFALDICSTWRDADEESSTSLNERALEDLHVLQAEGRVVLLSAPRAGHGKTHLLGRVAHRMSGEAVVATVPWQSAEDVSWAHCGSGVLHDLATGGARGTASLQTVCAGVLATLLRRLIQTGRIPSTDPAQALRVLAQDPMELFTEGGNARVIGDWFRRHFDQLRRPVAEISNIEGPAAVEDWLKGFFDYVDDPSSARLSELQARMQDDSSVEVPRFLRLLTMWRPLVLVADHMDGLYRDPASGVAVARMTLALVSLPGVYVVLSVNQDLWETTFGRQLPSALEDRLNARNVTLRGLTAKDAQDLVVLRLGEAGVGADDVTSFLRFIDIDRYFLGRPIGSVSARGLLRHASQLWRHWLVVDDVTPGDFSESSQMPAEGFLMEPAPVPVPMLSGTPPSAEAEDTGMLAANLAADAGGRVVSLSGPGAGPLPPMSGPAPNLISPATGNPPAGGSAGSGAPFQFTSPISTAPPDSPSSPGASNEGAPHTSFFPAHPAPAMTPSSGAPVASAPSEMRLSGLTEATATTFHKLRTMLANLKAATGSAPLPGAAFPLAEDAPPRHHGANGEATPPAASDLQARFEQYRHEIANTGRPANVEFPVINDLVRLAGRRFPVINYDEVELPGLLGRSLPRWSSQGMELVFGLEDFSDNRYWKTVSTFMVGRLAELHASTMDGGQPAAAQVKLVLFKGDAEAAGLANLLREENIPPALGSIVDAIHLDPRSLASLYAMHQIIKETESGSVQADTNAVLNMLANELDFFWKRVLLPKV